MAYDRAVITVMIKVTGQRSQGQAQISQGQNQKSQGSQGELAPL